MTFREKRLAFEQERKIYDSALLSFLDIDGYDVYNCSIPFDWKGKRYLYGRVERREEWARSRVMLFQETGPDVFTRVKNSMIYQLEDPFVSFIQGQLVLGGTHVRYDYPGSYRFYDYFYRGTDLEDLYYFATGPEGMKDVRLIQTPAGIGVFSRPRGQEVEKKYGSGAVVGFTLIQSLDELRPQLIESAPVIDGLFAHGEWGGCNQCYLLADGLIGVIGHKCYHQPTADGIDLQVYVNVAFVIDPAKGVCAEEKILATRGCYPEHPAKKPNLTDCAFSSGMVPRADGKVDLYSGLSDTAQGRVTIDNPFADHGGIVGY